MATVNSQGIDISERFSPIFWGYTVSLMIGGVAILQSYIYFSRTKDRVFVQILAAGVIVTDIVDSALVATSMHHYLISHFGSILQLETMTPELTVECLIATVITTISQCYFLIQLIAAKRLGKGSWVVIGVVGILCALAFAGGIACVVTMQMFHHSVFSDRSRVFSISFGVAKGFGAAADIVATIAVCLFLDSARTGMNKTNVILNTLIKYIIQRGILVTIVQTVLLVTFYAAPSSLAWFAFHLSIPKLYTNTFFAMLNARDDLRKLHLGDSVKFSGSRSYTNGEKNNVSQDVEHGNSTLNVHKTDGKAVRSHVRSASSGTLLSDDHDIQS